MYHAERHPLRRVAPNQMAFYSSLGLAKSDDNGSIFVDLGEIVTPNVSLAEAPPIVEVGGGGFVPVSGGVHTYFLDRARNSNQATLAAARVSGPVDTGSWHKYFDGAFSEPGIGGRSTPLNDERGM